MKIKTQELKDLLNLEDHDLNNLSVEQLRLLLGVCHYLARLTQREINGRLGDFSVGKKA
ncbi:MAG: hypothetical protein HY591_06620 [Candidatus Omnitrophica bacterium]|nr:hypothetical protein [Candidatus Omnitrophota bacterium]